MGKSLKNAVAPDEMCERYGADTLRLYEMFGGPLDQSRPWDTTAVVGMYRLLQRVWRVFVNEDDGTPRLSDDQPDDETRRILHRTIAAVRDGMETLRFNTSIARITELTNHLTATYPDGGVPREVAEPLALLLAPIAPHIAEELWARAGHAGSLAFQDYPVAIEEWLVDASVELPVSVNGKVRGRIIVAAGADAAALEAAARADDKVAALLDGATDPQGHRRPRQDGQLRRRLTLTRAGRRAPAQAGAAVNRSWSISQNARRLSTLPASSTR